MTINFNNFKDYACFDYISQVTPQDAYKLGDVVINQYNEIGVIIQMHYHGEFRTDMFGNAHVSEVRPATEAEILKHRPNIKTDYIN